MVRALLPHPAPGLTADTLGLLVSAALRGPRPHGVVGGSVGGTAGGAGRAGPGRADRGRRSARVSRGHDRLAHGHPARPRLLGGAGLRRCRAPSTGAESLHASAAGRSLGARRLVHELPTGPARRASSGPPAAAAGSIRAGRARRMSGLRDPRYGSIVALACVVAVAAGRSGCARRPCLRHRSGPVDAVVVRPRVWGQRAMGRRRSRPDRALG